MVFCKLPAGPDRPQLPENCCREYLGNCLPASVRQPPRLANMKGKPTKRIVRILTTKSAAGSHLTYEKELLNSGKNSHFYKTNHPGKGNNGGLGGLMEDPITIQITTFFACMPRMTLLSVSRSFYLPVTKSKVRYSSLAGVTRWYSCYLPGRVSTVVRCFPLHYLFMSSL